MTAMGAARPGKGKSRRIRARDRLEFETVRAQMAGLRRPTAQMCGGATGGQVV